MPANKFAAQRAEDAAYFQDWSCGEDKWGLWLWPEPIWRCIVVRPSGTAMVEIVNRLGGVEQRRHRYDPGHRHDWRIPAARWHELQQALPKLITLRAAQHNAWERQQLR